MKDRLFAHLQALVGERHPVSAPAKLQQVEAYLTAAFHGLGLPVERHPFEAFGRRYHNVVATLSGHARALPLIVGAHFDTVERSPGADDNASGLTVLLELARLFRNRPLTRPVRLIAFNLEEENLLGSSAYAADLRKAGETILGAIVLECVGYARSDPGSQQSPPNLPIPVPSTGDFLAVVGTDASQELVAAMTAAGSQGVSRLKVIPLLVPRRGELLPDTRRSDHAAFWDHGFPAVMLTDTANFRNPHYHRPTDTIETVNLSFLSQVTALVAAAVETLAG